MKWFATETEKMSVECPTCLAPVGALCEGVYDRRRVKSMHKARADAYRRSIERRRPDDTDPPVERERVPPAVKAPRPAVKLIVFTCTGLAGTPRVTPSSCGKRHAVGARTKRQWGSNAPVEWFASLDNCARCEVGKAHSRGGRVDGVEYAEVQPWD